VYEYMATVKYKKRKKNQLKSKSIIIGIAVAGILLSGMLSFQVFAQNGLGVANFDQSNSNEYVPGQVIVGLKQPDASFQAKANTIGGKVIDENNVLRALLIQVPKNAEDAFIKAIEKNPNVKFAEKNYIAKALSTPNDQYWSYQWNMRIIQADDAWDVPPIKQDIVVAVIDTGVQYTHPDLAANIWMNNDDCGDGIDDDSNGFFDDCRGWDFIDNDNNPMDESGHGTHVAGTIGAITDNVVGVAGLAQQMIMPVRVLGPDGGPDWVVAEGIIYAADNGADVINLSLGCYCPSLTLTENAIDHAYGLEHNVLVVAAAGNDNTNFPHFPSGFQNVMSVAATDKNDKKASYSNFGNTIEIAAPGGDSRGGHYSKTYVLSTYPTDNYAFGIGTSMATPHVSGVAALILSQDSSLTNNVVRDILKNTADDLGDPGWDQYYGEGRVNAYAAVNYVSGSPLLPSISINDVTQNEGNSGTTAFDFTVTRSDTTAAVSVDFATADLIATATESSDYTATGGTVNFAAGGSLTQQITVQVTGDTEVEAHETFVVNLSICVGCSISGNQGLGTILNDDSNVLQDEVVITKADYNTRNGRLHVDATYTDPNEELTVYDESGGFIGVMNNKGDGSYQLKIRTDDPGDTITVTSSPSGDSDTAPVT